MSAEPRVSTLHLMTASTNGKATILLLEDDAGIREALLKVLERGGYSVLAAHDRQEAMVLADRHTGRIDLLLADVSLPHIKSSELARDLWSRNRQMQVLYMSDYLRDEEHSTGAIRYIARPLKRQTLLARIRSILDGREASSVRIIP